ncbi:probable polyol transporter 3 [Rhodamnia argentea]|uniref:Probable polyol transporter 3 n=1 Tax=Rhodamnia argentea TaxID=178133 RepID=A0ABM3GTZ1_9MYRT|nr:probable polyol transporter 3 [Rhodamnia argentea]
MSRKPFFAQDPEMNEEETKALASHNKAYGIDALLQDPCIVSNSNIINLDKRLLTTTTIDLIKLVRMIFPIFLLHWVDSRPLMLFSNGRMFFSLISLGGFLGEVENNAENPTMCVVSSLFYMIFFFIGMAPIMLMYDSEMFLLRMCTPGSAIGIPINKGSESSIISDIVMVV